MNAYDAMRLIEDIGATGSRIEKEELVKRLAATEIGKFILNWSYNSFITYGITPAISPNSSSVKLSFMPERIKPLLEKLSRRELTGKAAEREVADWMSVLDEDGSRLLFLILSKDLKCGIGENTINQAMPGLIPVFSVQRAILYEAKRLKNKPYKAEFKLDGNRNSFLCKDGNAGFFTRSGKRVEALDFMISHVVNVAEKVAKSCSDELYTLLTGYSSGVRGPMNKTKLNFMLDGEAMMTLFEETGAFRRIREDAIGAELHLYDILPLADFNAVGAVGRPLKERRKLLEEFVRLASQHLKGTDASELIQIVPQFFVNSDAEVQELFVRARSMTLAKYLARGDEVKERELLKKTIDKATGKPKVLEGLVIKDPDALYEKKKSAAWMKLKAEETLDLPIIGVFSGSEHTKLENTLGGVILDHKGVEVRVGGGFSDDDREELWKLWELDAKILGIEPLIGFKGQTWAYDDLKNAGATNLMTRLLEVEFMEVTPDLSLRHPRALRFRDDKDGEVERIAA